MTHHVPEETLLEYVAGTCTDAACRLETSEASLLPRTSHTGQIKHGAL